jgi:cytochrome c oxidase subunit 2
MRLLSVFIRVFAALAAFILFTCPALAQTGAKFGAQPALVAQDPPVIGQPHAWGLDLQQAFSPSKHHMHDFHTLLLVIITAITIFVLALLVWVIVRYNKKANPVPKTFAHNTLVEVIWTAIPVLILIVIAIPSMKLLYFLDKTPNPEMTLKVTGHQWYWSYEYPDQKIESFDSRPIWDGTRQTQEQIDQLMKDASPNWLYKTEKPLRLLEVDNRVVLPVDTEIRIDATSADVIHAWAIPALGLKKDAVPGRLNETWVKIDKEGLYYGQCSEICGTGLAFLPIVVEAVSKEKFAAWVKKKAPAPAASNAAPVSIVSK